ncbi:hypothetical protein ACFS4T_05825 [Pseudomonas lini]
MSQALLMEFGATADPDNITTHCRYVFEQAGRIYVQEDKRSLTDLLLHGLHENGQRSQITFKSDGLFAIGPKPAMAGRGVYH